MNMVMRVFVIMWIGGMMLGCTSSPDTGGSKSPQPEKELEARLAKAPWIVKRCIAKFGGHGEWKDVSRVETQVLLSLTGPKGGTYHNCFELRLFLFEDHTGSRLVATAPTPKGKMVVAIDDKGEDEIPTSHRYPEYAAAKKAFAQLIRRVSGPFAMLTGDKKLYQSRKPVRIAGKDCYRVTKGKKNTESAFYLDAKTGELLFVTEGGDYPGSGGTLTCYTYQQLSNGAKFPKVIRIMKIGENVLLSDNMLLEADFQKVELIKAPQ